MSSRTETAPTSGRWTRSAALVVGWVLVVLLLLYFLELRPRSRTAAASVSTVPTVQPDFPAPPEGAVVYSREFGDAALALGVVPGTDQVIVQASVVGPEGDGVSGLGVSFGAQGSTVDGRSCGAGCYRATLPTTGAPRAIDVVVEGASTMRWSVALPETWPPADAASVLKRANGLALARVTLVRRDAPLGRAARPHELLADAGTRQARVPDPRRRFSCRRRQAAVDKVPGEPWEVSPQLPLRQPRSPWAAPRSPGSRDEGARGQTRCLVAASRPEDAASVHGDPRPQAFRTYDVRIVATAHFIHDTVPLVRRRQRSNRRADNSVKTAEGPSPRPSAWLGQRSALHEPLVPPLAIDGLRLLGEGGNRLFGGRLALRHLRRTSAGSGTC